MHDLLECTVKLSFPPEGESSTTRYTDVETWLTMLEQLLVCNYDNYTICTSTDAFHQRSNVEIVFANIEDAVWFRLQQRE